MSFIAAIWMDTRHALRALALSPGFTAAAVLAMAAGIGINTGIFSILNGLLLRELPAPQANELVSVHQTIEGLRDRITSGYQGMLSTEEYGVYRDRTETLSGLAAYSFPITVTLGGELPQEINGPAVSCNYFEVLRQRLAIGSGFTASNCGGSRMEPVVVLSHDLWTTAFGSDPSIVGRSVVLNRRDFVVVGVAPEGFAGVDFVKVSFFAPLSVQPLLRPSINLYDDAKASWLTVIGRRLPMSSLEQVRAELGVIAARIDLEQPGRNTTLLVEHARPFAMPEIRTAALAASGVVMAAFALVLLIACANVANLLLARATVRSREIALRLALGATRGRLIRRLLTESVLISLAGGVLGSLLALWAFKGLLVFALSVLPPEVGALRIDSTPDLTVLAFAIALAVGTGILFGLVPAIQTSDPDIHGSLKQDSAGAVGDNRRGSRGVLLGIQVAVCIVLTVSAGLLLRGLYEAQTVEPGFEYRDVTVASFDLTRAGYDEARATQFQARLMERVGTLPGVEGVAQASRTPLSAGETATWFKLPGEEQLYRIGLTQVSPQYFDLLGIGLVRGRAFTADDQQKTSTAAIITEATARRFWPGEDPLGRTLSLMTGLDQFTALEIVGIAEDVNLTSISEIDTSYVYLPAAPRVQATLELLIKSRADFAATAAGLRTVAQSLDPNLAVRVAPLEDNLEFWQGLARLVATLSGSLGALALVLAAIGVYGVVSYAVSRREREIGVRMALGAKTRDILRLVLGQTMRPVVIGAAIGIAVCAVVTRALSTVLFGVSPLDPVALVGATLFVLAVAFVAGALPAQRATRVDPTAALRAE